MSTAEPDGRPPILRVVRGDPDAAELAALVAVVQAGAVAAAASGELADAPPTADAGTQWAAPARLVRPNVGPVGWWQMGLPR